MTSLGGYLSCHLCSQCGETTLPKDAHSCFYKRAWVCSRVCLHAAGDRTCCYGWDCGCTKYTKKRRLLRQHRRQMRDMEDLIILHGLYEQYRRHATHYFDPHPHPEMDETSDAEDPEANAKEEAQTPALLSRRRPVTWRTALCSLSWSAPV